MKKRLVNTIQTLILKSDKDNTKKKTHRAILLINIDVKTLNKILSNLNLVIFSKDNLEQGRFIPEMQDKKLIKFSH